MKDENCEINVKWKLKMKYCWNEMLKFPGEQKKKDGLESLSNLKRMSKHVITTVGSILSGEGTFQSI